MCVMQPCAACAHLVRRRWSLHGTSVCAQVLALARLFYIITNTLYINIYIYQLGCRERRACVPQPALCGSCVRQQSRLTQYSSDTGRAVSRLLTRRSPSGHGRARSSRCPMTDRSRFAGPGDDGPKLCEVESPYVITVMTARGRRDDGPKL